MRSMLCMVVCLQLFPAGPWVVWDASADSLDVVYEGGLRFVDREQGYALKLQFLLQPQHRSTHTNNVTHTFLLRRGQIRLSGHYPFPQLSYKVMFEMPGSKGGATLNLRDLWVSYAFGRVIRVQFGQFLVHFDQENLQPAWSLQFVDRSILNAELGFERDTGFGVLGVVGKVGYQVFVMNGEGRNRQNTNDSYMVGGRFTWHVFGRHKLLVSDVDDSQKPILMLAGAGLVNREMIGGVDQDVRHFTGDLAFQFRGLSLMGAVNALWHTQTHLADWGYLVQGGVFVWPHRVEIAGRLAKIYRNDARKIGREDAREMGVVCTYFVREHHVKVQADARHIRGQFGGVESQKEVRFQTQLFF